MLLGAFITRKRGGEGTSDVQLTGIIKWAAKIKKKQKIPRASNKTPQNSWTTT